MDQQEPWVNTDLKIESSFYSLYVLDNIQVCAGLHQGQAYLPKADVAIASHYH